MLLVGGVVAQPVVAEVQEDTCLWSRFQFCWGGLVTKRRPDHWSRFLKVVSLFPPIRVGSAREVMLLRTYCLYDVV